MQKCRCVAERVWLMGWFAGLLAAGHALAQPQSLPADPLERQCWQRHTRERTLPAVDSTQVAFTTLRHGHAVRSPLQLAFAVRGMGLTPAGRPLAGTGHHHLLIDRPLPPDVSGAIPLSDTHRHFGKGQTSTTLNLPVGMHRLRLLFADHAHRPYYVYSPEITVQVTGTRSDAAPRIDPQRFDATCPAWYQDALSAPQPDRDWLGRANLRDGEPVTSPFTLQLGTHGLGISAAAAPAARPLAPMTPNAPVAPVGSTSPIVPVADKAASAAPPWRTGHFVLQVLQGGRQVHLLDLRNGATQATLALPNGNYLVRLRLVDGRSGNDLLPPMDHRLPVTAQQRM